MTVYTIEIETNNITAHATKQDAKAVPNSECFGNAEQLAKLAANWPTARLIEIWNGIPGVTPVKKFTDRKAATARIWKAVQSWGESIPTESATEGEANVSAQSPDVAPGQEKASKKATRQKKAPTGERKPKAKYVHIAKSVARD